MFFKYVISNISINKMFRKGRTESQIDNVSYFIQIEISTLTAFRLASNVCLENVSALRWPCITITRYHDFNMHWMETHLWRDELMKHLFGVLLTSGCSLCLHLMTVRVIKSKKTFSIVCQTTYNYRAEKSWSE